MTRDRSLGMWLKKVQEHLGGYPNWEPDFINELEAFASNLSTNQKNAPMLGSEVQAALNDPPWKAELLHSNAGLS